MNRIAALLLLLFAVLSLAPALAQNNSIAEDMDDFVEKGYDSDLTNLQISTYIADWSDSDWLEFYEKAARYAGLSNPRGIAELLLAEDKANQATSNWLHYFSAVITRVHQSSSSQLTSGSYSTNQRDCDDNPDTEYLFPYSTSASGVSSMEWYSTNGWIGMLLGTLKAYGNDNWTRICVGDNRICLIGGVFGCSTGASWTQTALNLIP